jgi:hypothetical protein
MDICTFNTFRGDIMKKMVLAAFLLFVNCGSNNFLKYGYLPGGDYKYYAPINKVDLKGRSIYYIVNDKRNGINKIECSGSELDRKTELEGNLGLDYFTNYLKAMTESNNGKVSTDAVDTIKVDLLAISCQIYGFGFLRVFGDTKFKIEYKDISREYCAEISDGDKDSPLGLMSWDSRRGALRKLASASARKALEKFMIDLNSIFK